MTAYDVRISDWSSDVCSSDLASRMLRTDHPQSMRNYVRMFGLLPYWETFGDMEHSVRTGLPASDGVTSGFWAYRSEARRVGKECVSTSRYRWSANHYKKTTHTHK